MILAQGTQHPIFVFDGCEELVIIGWDDWNYYKCSWMASNRCFFLHQWISKQPMMTSSSQPSNTNIGCCVPWARITFYLFITLTSLIMISLIWRFFWNWMNMQLTYITCYHLVSHTPYLLFIPLCRKMYSIHILFAENFI